MYIDFDCFFYLVQNDNGDGSLSRCLFQIVNCILVVIISSSSSSSFDHLVNTHTLSKKKANFTLHLFTNYHYYCWSFWLLKEFFHKAEFLENFWSEKKAKNLVRKSCWLWYVFFSLSASSNGFTNKKKNLPERNWILRS